MPSCHPGYMTSAPSALQRSYLGEPATSGTLDPHSHVCAALKLTCWQSEINNSQPKIVAETQLKSLATGKAVCNNPISETLSVFVDHHVNVQFPQPM